jgi:hypothetical protein
MTERATSRAGIAKADWYADAGGWKVVLSGSVTAQRGAVAQVTSSPSATVDATAQTVGGVTGYHGSAAITYTTPSITPLSETACGDYQLTGPIAGTIDVTIVPSADGTQITATLLIHDVVSATITCPGDPAPITVPQGGVLVGTVNYQSANPSVTALAGMPSDHPLSWNTSFPLPATGQLTIHIEPLSS